MNKLILTLFVIALVITGCGDPSPQSQSKPYLRGDVYYKIYGVNYFKDERTDICFAERMLGSSDSYSFTEVSCDKVDAYYNLMRTKDSNSTSFGNANSNINSNINVNKERK